MEHTFPGPGNRQVYATVRNLAADNPGERTWTETIVIDETLEVTCPGTDKAGIAAVTVVDGAGNLATSHRSCRRVRTRPAP